jgi:hypothetical protein
VGVLLQVGRGHHQTLHALTDELLLLLQARLTSWGTETDTGGQAHTQNQYRSKS